MTQSHFGFPEGTGQLIPRFFNLFIISSAVESA